MKRFFTAALCAGALACATYGPVMLQTEGPLRRQVERVVERHDKYVKTDLAISAQQRVDYLGQSASSLELTKLPEVSAGLLSRTLAPVLDRHDAYVYEDGVVDELERSVYLGSSAALRSLLSKARAQEVPQN